MRTLIRIVPKEVVKTYSGTSAQTGNAYKIDTWLAHCPATNNDIVFTCFGDVSDYLQKKKNLEVDGELLMKCKQYNGNYYNDVTFVNPVKDQEEQDIPASQPAPVTQQSPNMPAAQEEDDDLPF